MAACASLRIGRRIIRRRAERLLVKRNCVGSTRAASILVQLPDSELKRGLQAVRAHAAGAATDKRVVEPIDFFVFHSL
jgi:hypothetical protein